MPELFILIISMLLGSVLLITGTMKIINFRKFQLAVREYRIFPREMSDIVSFLIIPWSIIAGLFLISGLYIDIGAVMAFAYILTGTSGVISVLYRKMKVRDCGCYGALIRFPVNKFKLLDDLFWLSLSTILLVYSFGIPGFIS